MEVDFENSHDVEGGGKRFNTLEILGLISRLHKGEVISQKELNDAFAALERMQTVSEADFDCKNNNRGKVNIVAVTQRAVLQKVVAPTIQFSKGESIKTDRVSVLDTQTTDWREGCYYLFDHVYLEFGGILKFFLNDCISNLEEDLCPHMQKVWNAYAAGLRTLNYEGAEELYPHKHMSSGINSGMLWMSGLGEMILIKIIDRQLKKGVIDIDQLLNDFEESIGGEYICEVILKIASFHLNTFGQWERRLLQTGERKRKNFREDNFLFANGELHFTPNALSFALALAIRNEFMRFGCVALPLLKKLFQEVFVPLAVQRVREGLVKLKEAGDESIARFFGVPSSDFAD